MQVFEDSKPLFLHTFKHIASKHPFFATAVRTQGALQKEAYDGFGSEVTCRSALPKAPVAFGLLPVQQPGTEHHEGGLRQLKEAQKEVVRGSAFFRAPGDQAPAGRLLPLHRGVVRPARNGDWGRRHLSEVRSAQA